VLKTRFKAKPFQRAQICEDLLLKTGVQRGQKTANNKYDYRLIPVKDIKGNYNKNMSQF
jgi:hypothetical protein